MSKAKVEVEVLYSTYTRTGGKGSRFRRDCISLLPKDDGMD